ADLLRVGVAAGGGTGRLLQHPPEEAPVVLRHLGVDVPGGEIGGDRVLLQPLATGELVEIDARIDRAVHYRGVEARRIGERGERALGRRLRGDGRRAGEAQQGEG